MRAAGAAEVGGFNMSNRQFSRRQCLRAGLAGSAAVAAPAILSRPARAAEFSYKLATTIPADHPLNQHARKAAKAIATQSGGRLQIDVFPDYQLGSSSSSLSQLREGSIELVTLSGSVLSTLVPVTTIYNTAYAFADYDQVWRAMDGSLGDYLRKRISGAGIYAFDKHWDLGFRQITASKPIMSPEDLRGLKIRVPVAPLFLAAFKALGASPTAINFDELYTALQTKIVDGQENDLINIRVGRLYEVQKYCSMTGHIWDGYFTLANSQALHDLPDDLRGILESNLNTEAVAERETVKQTMLTVREELAKSGLSFVEPDRATFRAELSKSGFYAETRTKFGKEAWELLEATVGPLA